jgi:hypothetical protein
VVVVVTGARSSPLGDEDRCKNPETESKGEKRKDDRKRRYINNITQHVKRRER